MSSGCMPELSPAVPGMYWPRSCPITGKERMISKMREYIMDLWFIFGLVPLFEELSALAIARYSLTVHSETPHGSFPCLARPYPDHLACSERNTRPCKEKNRPFARASLRPALMDQNCQRVLADCAQPSFAPQGFGSN